MANVNSLNARDELVVEGRRYTFYSLTRAAEQLGDLSRLPRSLRVLLENLLRNEDGSTVTREDIEAVARWGQGLPDQDIAFRPTRVLLQDFTGVPAVVDLAAMRDAMVALGGDPQKVNPLQPVDLVIDHSVQVDHFGNAEAFGLNVRIEMRRNAERYSFLKWGSTAFTNFSVVPPGTGICHQVNLEYLGRCIDDRDVDGEQVAFFDTLVGTDSHTVMINGLSVLGWGVGGIEAEAAMLGQPISMRVPEVVGFRLTEALAEGATATDLVLTVVDMIRQHGAVGKFVEFYGPGLRNLTLADRATIANMAPEYGATCGFFPIDKETINYLRFTGRSEERVELVEAYAKAQGMWVDENSPEPLFRENIELDMSTVVPSLAGPRRPQDRIALTDMVTAFAGVKAQMAAGNPDATAEVELDGATHSLTHGAITIAAITSCTNTSNPAVLVAAGLVARKARALGVAVKPWVKTSLAPGSKVVTDYLDASGLTEDLDALGFHLVGYGCTTCIGNSGPLIPAVQQGVVDNDLIATSVLSGNRNFDGRISPYIKANYLASPPLVVAFALAGRVDIDLSTEPVGTDSQGRPVMLKDIWPSSKEIQEVIGTVLSPAMFKARYDDVFSGDAAWQAVEAPAGDTYDWQPESTYVRNPPFFEGMGKEPEAIADIEGARLLALLGRSITTDHISPAGSIAGDSPAGRYLTERDVKRMDFNSYGSRRGNHEVMMRGTFANVRLRNLLVADGRSGGWTTHLPTGEVMSVYDAAMKYQDAGTQLVIVAGSQYGTGSSRDWAAKGTLLLGVRAVIAESFERIHRSNLIGMGVLPLQFPEGVTAETLGLTGAEAFTIRGLSGLTPRSSVTVEITGEDGNQKTVEAAVRLDTADELAYYNHGGILQYVLRNLA